MSFEVEIPEEVVAEIEANRKVNAIKLLRRRLGIDVREAREMVNTYIEQNPATSHPGAPDTDAGIGRILILVIGVGVIYGVYRFLVG